MNMKIISHLSPEYLKLPITHDNGAFYYSKELLENIVPKIKTKRNWILINAEGKCFDNSIVIIHNNKNPERYQWLEKYKNLILVCSQPKTLKKLIEMHPKFHSIYIPLSIDTNYVKKFRVKKKTKETGYFGRIVKCPDYIKDDETIDKIYGLDRDKLLKTLAKYKKVYAIGRCALEAKCLGCEVLTHEGEYEGVDFELLDNKDVIDEFQRLINEIDKK